MIENERFGRVFLLVFCTAQRCTEQIRKVLLKCIAFSNILLSNRHQRIFSRSFETESAAPCAHHGIISTKRSHKGSAIICLSFRTNFFTVYLWNIHNYIMVI